MRDSNESKKASSYYSSIGNRIVGTANRTFNSYGVFIFVRGKIIMKTSKILLAAMVLTSIATSAFASRAVNIISGDGKNIATAFRDRDAYRWDTSTGTLVKSGTDLEYIVSLNEDLKEIKSAKFKENVGPFGEKSNLAINSDILEYTKSNVDNSNSGTSYLTANELYLRTDDRNHPDRSASSTFRADLISMYQDSKSIRIAPGMDGIKAEDISENYSEFDHLTSIPTMSHLDKRGETKIDGSVIELHNKAVNGEDEQLTAIDGKHISFNKSGDYKTSVDVDGISTLHYDQGMSAYAGGIDVWGHKNNDDTTELREMSFSVSKVDVGGQQIHGVSNGEADTDAINVAQLKKAEEKINDVKAEAKKHTTVVAGDNTTVIAGTNAAGGAEYKVSVKKDLEDMNSVNFGKITDDVRARIDKDSARFFNGSENIGITPKGIQIENTDTLEQANFTKYGMYASEGDKTVYYTTNGISAGDQKINNVKAGEADTDAVNMAQLKKVDDKVTAVENKVNTVETKVNDLDTKVNTVENKVNTVETKVNTIETKVNDVETKVNNVDTKVNNLETKVNTVEAEAKKHTTVVAGDNTTVTQGTNANGGAEYKVAVNKDLVEMNSVNFGKATDDVRARIDKDSARFFNGSENIGVTPKGIQIENTDTLEQATFTKSGMYASEGDKTVYYTTNGISAGDQIINNVKAGVADTDAVNVSQLKKVKDEITAATGTTTVTAGDHITVTPTINGNSRDYKVSLSKDITDQINNNTTNIDKNAGNIAKNTEDIKNIKGNVTDIQNNIININNNMNSFKGDLSKMDKRIDKSVAGAAALAALHPLDFDPDAKWDFAAGYGHYRSGDAAAIGAFYRPNEDVQLSIGSTVGGDETVFNAGLSVKVGAHSGVSRSRVAIGKEVLALKKTVAEQNAQIQKLTALLNGVAGTKMKADHTTLFPDVAANHWAYEAVSDLSRRGLVEGYPDGTFGGDRLLTRYEFAQIVYRAIQDGVTVDDRLVTEFSPEMALFRVDTVAKNAQGEPTIERVRVNKK